MTRFVGLARFPIYFFCDEATQATPAWFVHSRTALEFRRADTDALLADASVAHHIRHYQRMMGRHVGVGVFTAGLAPTANGAGWNNTNVIVTYTCGDLMSGTASCGPDQTVSTEGSAVPYSGTAVDNAGNTATASGTVKIDKTVPTISAGFSPAANGAGWNNTNVTVTYTCGDLLSGVASCGPDELLSTEGSAVPYSGTAVDNAGNPATASGTVKIDMTVPTISAGLSPAANLAGWNKTNVNVTYTCADALSGVASCGPNQLLSTEGSAVAYSGTAVDNAGNTSAVSGTVKIDKTAPTVAVTGVANGAQYVLGSVPVAGCSTTDTLSGVATAATVTSSGGPVGFITTTCSGGTDVASNAASSVSVTYSIIYAFTGFFQPVDNLPARNSVKAGSAIPVKFSLGGNQGLGIMAAGFPTSITSTCDLPAPEDVVEETVTAGNSSLSYDAVASFVNPSAVRSHGMERFTLSPHGADTWVGTGPQ